MVATVLFYFALVFLVGLFLTSLVATGDKGRGVESLSEKAMKFDALIFSSPLRWQSTFSPHKAIHIYTSLVGFVWLGIFYYIDKAFNL